MSKGSDKNSSGTSGQSADSQSDTSGGGGSGDGQKKSFQEGYVPSKRSYQAQDQEENPVPPQGGTGVVRPQQSDQSGQSEADGTESGTGGGD